MRLAGLLLSLTFMVTGLVSSGCKDKGDASASTDPAALKAQQDLMARRDALMTERKKLESDLDAVEVKIKEAPSGTDVTPLEKQRDDLKSQLQKKDTETSSLSSELSKAQALTGNVTGREAELAARERQLALREAALADRERDSIRALTDAAKQFKESCSAGGTSMIVQVPAPSKGSNYSRAEVDGVYAKARKIMREKGLIPGDQWAGASLESETQQSLSKNDWSTAFVTATQLANFATQFKVDRGFVQAKIGRLNAIVKSTKRDEAVQKQLTDGLGDVMGKFGDGNHIGANAKLNQLFGLVR